MNIVQYLKSKAGLSISYEIRPPERGNPIEELYQLLDPLAEFKPAFISIANHQSEEKYSTDKTGRFIKNKPDKRPGWLSFSYALKKRYAVEVLPHLICNELTPGHIEDLLVGLNYMDIQNVMALRGDRLGVSAIHLKEMGRYDHASQIVKQVANLNNGLYLDESIRGLCTNFCIAVAGYPEQHPQAIDADTDILRLKEKVNAGAHFIVTQIFYKNEAYATFVEKCRMAEMDIPILPGLKPIYRKENIDVYREKFKVSVPKELRLALQTSDNEKEQAVIGREWLLNQCRDLITTGTRHLHFFIFSPKDAEIVDHVLKRIL